jgi:acyl-CoA thioester hydrolase
MRPQPHDLDAYPHKLAIPTRWNDNDVYGHVNNAIYYLYFDTVVNRYLVDNGLLAVGESETVGLVVDTGCAYFAPISFPDEVIAGLRVAHIGSTSIKYEIGLFRNDETKASAQGHFIHVYVNEVSRRPATLSDAMKDQLAKLRA